jgi:hypothetical protein
MSPDSTSEDPVPTPTGGLPPHSRKTSSYYPHTISPLPPPLARVHRARRHDPYLVSYERTRSRVPLAQAAYDDFRHGDGDACARGGLGALARRATRRSHLDFARQDATRPAIERRLARTRQRLLQPSQVSFHVSASFRRWMGWLGVHRKEKKLHQRRIPGVHPRSQVFYSICDF